MFRAIFSFTLVLLSCLSQAQTNLMQKLYNTELTDQVLEDKPEFTLMGELGVLFALGNTQASTLKTGLTSEHEMRKWSNKYKADLLYRQQQTTDNGVQVDETTAHRLYLSAQMDYKLTKQSRRLFLFAEYEDDRFDGFEYQASLAAGWSQQFWKRDNSQLTLSLGPGYGLSPTQEAQDDIDEHSVILRGALEFHYSLSDSARFRQFISTEADRYGAKSRAESEFTAKLFDYLAMKLSFVLRHNDNVSDDVRKLDTQTAVTLVYQFF